jgi:hypothetical protein
MLPVEHRDEITALVRRHIELRRETDLYFRQKWMGPGVIIVGAVFILGGMTNRQDFGDIGATLGVAGIIGGAIWLDLGRRSYGRRIKEEMRIAERLNRLGCKISYSGETVCRVDAAGNETSEWLDPFKDRAWGRNPA